MGISGQGCGYVCGMAFGVWIMKGIFGNSLSLYKSPASEVLIQEKMPEYQMLTHLIFSA